MTKKLELARIEIQSFITITETNQKAIRGGTADGDGNLLDLAKTTNPACTR